MEERNKLRLKRKSAIEEAKKKKAEEYQVSFLSCDFNYFLNNRGSKKKKPNASSISKP